MKSKLLALLALLPIAAWAADSANQVALQQRNSGNTGYSQVNLVPTASTLTLWGFTTAGGVSQWPLSTDFQISGGNIALLHNNFTIAGSSVALGGSISLDTITGLGSTGIVYRSAANTLANVGYTGGSLTFSGGNLTLSGDSATPGASMVYGTDGSGTKGWQAAGSGGWTSGVLFTTAGSTTNISNSTTETTIFTGTISGGTLGSNNPVRIHLQGRLMNNTGSPAGFTINIKYGGTTMFSASTGNNIATSTNPRWWNMDFDLEGDNATGAQRVGGIVGGIGAAGTTPPLSGSVGLSPATVAGTSAVDSTTNQTFSVTVTASTASTSMTWTTDYGYAARQ